MKYDWMCAAYASAPTLSKQGRAHRAKYIKHWSKKAKPVSQTDIDHEMALAHDRRRDKVKRRLEQRKLERAYSEEDRRKLKGDDWEVGDWVVCTSAGVKMLELGEAYQISSIVNSDYIRLCETQSDQWHRNLFTRVPGKTRDEALQSAYSGVIK